MEHTTAYNELMRRTNSLAKEYGSRLAGGAALPATTSVWRMRIADLQADIHIAGEHSKSITAGEYVTLLVLNNALMAHYMREY